MRGDKDGNWVARLEAEEVFKKQGERIRELENIAKNARKNVLFIQNISNKKQEINEELKLFMRNAARNLNDLASLTNCNQATKDILKGLAWAMLEKTK